MLVSTANLLIDRLAFNLNKILLKVFEGQDNPEIQSRSVNVYGITEIAIFVTENLSHIKTICN